MFFFILCVLLGAVAAQVPPRSLRFDFSTMPPPQTWSTINGAQFISQVLQLNADLPNINAAAYFSTPVWTDQWSANFSFSLSSSPNGHNGGMTFVVQGDNVAKAGPNNAGIGYGSNPGSADIGLMKSLVVEFDTFYDKLVDDTLEGCETPHFSVHSLGAQPNTAVENGGNVGNVCFKQFPDPYSPPNAIHTLKIVYTNPYLAVFYDALPYAILNVSYDIANLQLGGSLGYIGFTASTGPAGGDSHMIHTMAYEYLSDLDALKSTIDGLTNPVTAGSIGTFIVNSIDQFGHPYPFGGATLQATLLNSPNAVFQVTDLQNGTYSVTFNSTVAANDQLSVSLNGLSIQGSPFDVGVQPGVVDPSLAQAVGDTTYARAGIAASVTVKVFDQYQNPTGSPCDFTGTTLKQVPVQGNTTIALQGPTVAGTGEWVFTYTAQLVGEYEWHIVTNGVTIKNQPANLFVSSGVASAANSRVAGLSSAFTVADAQTFVVSVFDGSGNPYTGQVNLSVSIILAGGAQAANVTLISEQDAKFTYSFVVYTSGTWTPLMTVDGTSIPGANGVPAQLTVASGPISPQNSFISYPNNAPMVVQAGTAMVTSLTVEDLYGNVATSNDGIVWTVAINGQSYDAIATPQTTGLFTVSWLPTVAKNYIMTAALGAPPVPVTNSGAYTVTVTADPTPSVSHTKITGDGQSQARVGEQTEFWVQAEDSYGNIIGSEIAVTVAISSTDANPIQAKVSTVYVPSNSSWTVSYMCPTTGVWHMILQVGGQLYGGGPQVINVTGGLSGGAIAGIVCASLAGVALMVGVILIWRRKRRVYQPL